MVGMVFIPGNHLARGGGGRKNQSCELDHPLHNNLTTLSRKEKKSNNLCTLSRKISALSTSHHLCLESASFLTISWYCQEEKKSYNDFFTLSRKISSFTSSSHCQAKHRLKNIYLTNSSHSQEKHLLKTTFNLRTYLAYIIYNTFKKNILLQHLQHFSDPAASFRIRWAKFLATAASWPL